MANFDPKIETRGMKTRRWTARDSFPYCSCFAITATRCVYLFCGKRSQGCIRPSGVGNWLEVKLVCMLARAMPIFALSTFLWKGVERKVDVLYPTSMIHLFERKNPQPHSLAQPSVRLDFGYYMFYMKLALAKNSGSFLVFIMQNWPWTLALHASGTWAWFSRTRFIGKTTT